LPTSIRCYTIGSHALPKPHGRVRSRWILATISGLAAEKSENFDTDPGWDAHNNRSAKPEPRTIRQDFGYSPTRHVQGATPGEIGGFINPAAEPAYYAKKIPEKTFNDPLSASGKLVCEGRQFHVLLGFFNADTLNEWRTPNSIAIRLQGRGDVFYAYVEYTTNRWRAGGDTPGGFSQVRNTATGRMQFKGFPTGPAVHEWTMRYDPNGNNGTGSITVTLDGETSICHLDKDHKADGATFNRFGLLTVMKQWDTGGEVWLDDVTINGERETFDREPAGMRCKIGAPTRARSCVPGSISAIARRSSPADAAPVRWVGWSSAAMVDTPKR
jgi:hypothetical protein